jgi:hypothetical protein
VSAAKPVTNADSPVVPTVTVDQKSKSERIIKMEVFAINSLVSDPLPRLLSIDKESSFRDRPTRPAAFGQRSMLGSEVT